MIVLLKTTEIFHMRLFHKTVFCLLSISNQTQDFQLDRSAPKQFFSQNWKELFSRYLSSFKLKTWNIFFFHTLLKTVLDKFFSPSALVDHVMDSSIGPIAIANCAPMTLTQKINNYK